MHLDSIRHLERAIRLFALSLRLALLGGIALVFFSFRLFG